MFGLLARKRTELNLLIERLRVAFDISDGVQYIHGHGKCHHNLHVSSVGFNVKNQVQIMEFGKAVYKNRPTEHGSETSDGSAVTRGSFALLQERSGPFPVNTGSTLQAQESGFQKDVLDCSRIVCEVMTVRLIESSMSDRQGKACIRLFCALASLVPRRLLGMLQRGLSDHPDSRPTITEFRDCLNEVLFNLIKENRGSSGTPMMSLDPHIGTRQQDRRSKKREDALDPLHEED